MSKKNRRQKEDSDEDTEEGLFYDVRESRKSKRRDRRRFKTRLDHTRSSVESGQYEDYEDLDYEDLDY
jgi:hypothetical protein